MRTGLAVAVIVAMASSAASVYGDMLQYVGRLERTSTPFESRGSFRFALVDGDGRNLWTQDGSHLGLTEAPLSSSTLAIENGRFFASLGNPAAGMAPIPSGLLRRVPVPRLVVWFEDENHGLEQYVVDALPGDGAHGPTELPTSGLDSDLHALVTELRAMRAELVALRHDMRTSKERVGNRTEPANLRVTMAWDDTCQTMGSLEAPLVLVEFSDYQCGYCQRFYRETFLELKKAFIDTGKVLFISRSMPLRPQSPAEAAAVAALCAGEQGHYWEMRDKLFGETGTFDAESIKGLAAELGMDAEAFSVCLGAASPRETIAADKALAGRVGISGTPSFVLGVRQGAEVHGERLVGAKPFSFFEARINALLAAAGDS